MNHAEKIPLHVAIIPDGNRRWARERHLPSIQGHRVGAEKNVPALLKKASELKIKYLTFWVLSPENFIHRSAFEIRSLFSLKYFLMKQLKELKENGVRLKIIGDLKKLPADLQKDIEYMEMETKEGEGITLILAVNYGGRDEIIRAIKKLDASHASLQSLTKEQFSASLDTVDIPDPELIIRTGGEQRLSGFMLWQNEYTEFYFSDLYFPDFSPEELEKAVEEFQSRQRRFGK